MLLVYLVCEILNFFLAFDSLDQNLFVTNCLSFLLISMHLSIQVSNRVRHPTKSILAYDR